MANKLGSLRKYSRNVRNDPEYVVWKGIRARITNPKHVSYMNYGGRGITLSPVFDNYEEFLRCVGRRPSPSHSIERIDNDKGYEPGNVCWTTVKEQCRNTRDNRYLTYRGETKSMVEWCEELTLPYSTIRYRTKAGWSVEDAFNKPIREGKYKRKSNANFQ